MKIFEVYGYFNDDNTSINGCLVAEYDCDPEDDEDIFYYGLGESELIGDHGDFTITGYWEV